MTTYSNPYGAPTFGTDVPEALGDNPLAKPKTDGGRHALGLYCAARDATERLQGARDAQIDCARALTAAREALHEEVGRGGREGIDQEREHELALALAAAEHRADPNTHRIRYGAALEAQRRAALAWKSFIWDNFTQLLEGELRADAEKASRELRKALATIEPHQARYLETANRVRALVAILVHGKDAQEWARFFSLAPSPEPPLPSDEALAGKYRLEHPEEFTPQPVEEASEELAEV